jgi:hypothetical protein
MERLMTDQKKTEAEFDEAARRWFRIQDQEQHENKMEAFRAGRLGPVETEQIIADEVARGDAERQRKYLQALREERELGAKLRTGITR